MDRYSPIIRYGPRWGEDGRGVTSPGGREVIPVSPAVGTGVRPIGRGAGRSSHTVREGTLVG